jgi:hypothetical protein
MTRSFIGNTEKSARGIVRSFDGTFFRGDSGRGFLPDPLRRRGRLRRWQCGLNHPTHRVESLLQDLIALLGRALGTDREPLN